MDGEQRTARRRAAAGLFGAGRSQAEVARELGVSRTTAMRWFRAWRAEGRLGLVREQPPGRPHKLAPDELNRVLAALPRRASVEEVCRAIFATTGVRYHPGHVWRLLKAWGWTEEGSSPAGARLSDPDGHALVLLGGPPRSP